jgi:uncharacterized protein involved in exopolysaccharide biosynthesis
MANVVLRHRGPVAMLALLAAVATGVFTLTRPREYESRATFVPQVRQPAGAGSISGLAATLGLSMGSGDPAQSPQFYVDLAASREILGRVADTRFTFPTDSGVVSATPVDLYAARERRRAYRRDVAIEELRDVVKTRVAATTGVVELTVTVTNPHLARQIANRVLDLINEFNLNRRQSQAAAERRFTEQRLAEVRSDLRAAENRLEAFQQGNRGFDAPTLRLQETRLRRDLSLQQQLFLTLSQAYEQAKIDEVRDTPVVTVIETPETPVRPEPRGTVRKTVLALIGGALLGMALAFAREVTRGGRDDESPEFAEFQALKRATADDIKHPWRPVARRPRRAVA